MLGNTLQCTAPDNGNAPQVIGWTWVVQASAPDGFIYPVAFQSNGGSVTFDAYSPVTYIVSCTVSYPPPGQPKKLPPINIIY